ncbi:MAG: hypothetical protein WDM71_09000 [Ferruginibacter sp.]
MNNSYKGKTKYISAFAMLLLLVALTATVMAEKFLPKYSFVYPTADSIPANLLQKDFLIKDTTNKPDSSAPEVSNQTQL